MAAERPFLIRDAELLSGVITDVRVAQGRVAAMGALAVMPGEPVVEARGGLLLPGLHDHHLHLAATAAARRSVRCGPPEVSNAEELAQALRLPGTDWLRGVGYHESVAGMLDRRWLDRVAPDRPVRIQHRGGRMWFLNSVALDCLLAGGEPVPPGLDIATGRLFDEDAWLRRALGGSPPSLAELSRAFARYGVTGLTDMGPANGPAEHSHFAREQASGALRQRLVIAGTPGLAALGYGPALMLGPVKLHLHDADLPPYDAAVASIAAAHGQGRGVAIHCVTEAELVFALAALSEAGVHPSDRIEHASVTPDGQLAEIRALGLAVVAQPLFVFERGDTYRQDIAAAEWPLLYRLRSFLDAGVPMAGSSDAPYVDIDPWAAMNAAVARRTRAGEPLGLEEAIAPEQALALYLADPLDLRKTREVAVGAPADLCLLDRPWAQVRDTLSAERVRLTWIAGAPAYDAAAG